MVNPLSSPLLADLYEYTMLESYLAQGMDETAVFEFFVRKLPPGRNFMVAGGLEQALVFLENLCFAEAELAWLARRFSPRLVDYLRGFRFTGDVSAMAEGTPFFPDEPILRVTAPLPQAQLVESRLMNLLHFQSLIASKAARSVLAAPGKLLVDFGLRRAHGAEAGLLAARASYLAGFAGSATVLAGLLYDIPLFGTMAHSFVQAHETESLAFEHFARTHPGNATLLIDTYDTEAGAAKVGALALRLKAEGIDLRGVRIDSGDLAEHARRVRRILDDAGLREMTIFVSGGLDEYQIRDLLAAGAPIDGFGVGTALDTSEDAPALDCAYKLQEYAGRPRRKRSVGKATWPGRKQVYRQYTAGGELAGDVLALAEGDPHPGEALIQPVMRGGGRLAPAPSLTESRERALSQYARLPAALRALEAGPAYPVAVSAPLREMAAAVDRGTG